jgi:hypothetical protein
MRTLPIVALTVFLVSTAAAQLPTMDEADRIRLEEAFRLADAVTSEVWPGWEDVPFALLLITENQEFLVRHPRPSDDFTSIGFDDRLQSQVLVRDRVFPPHLMASFPAVGGVPTVVIGQPEATRKSSTYWVLTAIHEHFHQFQMGWPGYADAVEALDLAAGDETGMWMLEYPFPYEDGDVQRLVGDYRDAIVAALQDASAVSDYANVRAQFAEALDPADYRYLSFQIWQEGVARYVEMRTAEEASKRHQPTREFTALDDFVPYTDAAASLNWQLDQELASLDLAAQRRFAFYPLGAAEAFVLDAVRPGWQSRYFKEPFRLERYAGAPINPDTSSPEAIIAALYDVISGPAGENRDWDRFHALFAPGGLLIPTGRRPDGERVMRIQTPQDYIDTSGPLLEEHGFFEHEIARNEQRFGNIVHVWSTYEARQRATDPEPFMRGINSIQLFDDGERWWIITVMWDSERPETPIPERYLPGE